MNMQQRSVAAMQRLAKWRTVLAGWQLGTRPKGDPECDAVRDHREVTLVSRADLNALLELCLAKGLFSIDEWNNAVWKEADQLNKDYEQRFPGIRATEDGITFDGRAVETMKGWRP